MLKKDLCCPRVIEVMLAKRIVYASRHGRRTAGELLTVTYSSEKMVTWMSYFCILRIGTHLFLTATKIFNKLNDIRYKKGIN